MRDDPFDDVRRDDTDSISRSEPARKKSGAQVARFVSECLPRQSPLLMRDDQSLPIWPALRGRIEHGTYGQP